MKKIAVILNGCGHRDGSEIHEAVLTLLGIENAGATWEALALNKPQARVVNHLDGNVETDEPLRNMLKESARLARGRVKDLRTANVDDYAAVIIPGGNGTASNLCDFATKGAHMTVIPEVSTFLEGAHGKKKPIGAVCIAPMLLAKIFGENGVHLTLGSPEGDAAKAARTMGAKVSGCEVEDCIVDETLKIVTTPAYMLDATVSQVAIGIAKLAQEIVRLI
jgi:enhancing lycopene biosynthesis protein 2